MTELPNIAFLDFEASSLGKHGYPIEVAWVFGDGQEESHLIRPAPTWTDWDAGAEAVHGISRGELAAEGAPLETVAQRMVTVLTGATLYATAPSWDGKWLSKLLRAAGLPRHALRLQDTDMAHRRVLREILKAGNVPADLQKELMRDILAQAQRRDDEHGPAAHRALADAQREQRLWLDIRQRAVDAASQLGHAEPGPVRTDRDTIHQQAE
jgi:hypothetical protein